MTLSGHLWTLLPTARHGLRPFPAPGAAPWSARFEDAHVGNITLTGRLARTRGADTCLVIVHGLGGDGESFYCRLAAAAAEEAGIAHLRLNLRGADLSGADFYHAGLVDDLHVALHSPALAMYRHILVLGFSLGGHIALRLGLDPQDPRVRAVAAVCPPLNLSLSSEALNLPEARLYQYALLRGLREVYHSVAARKPVAASPDEIRGARTVRDWDRLTVVPRFGFSSTAKYYEQMSVGPRLADLQRPALIVSSANDPMIPPWTYADVLNKPLPRVTWHHLPTGGHVAFPRSAAVNLHAIQWLMSHR